jgi:hypothetical protein
MAMTPPLWNTFLLPRTLRIWGRSMSQVRTTAVSRARFAWVFARPSA